MSHQISTKLDTKTGLTFLVYLPDKALFVSLSSNSYCLGYEPRLIEQINELRNWQSLSTNKAVPLILFLAPYGRE